LAAGKIADANTIQDTIDYTSNNFFLSNLSNFNANFSNLSLAQGFLNSNIQTAQTLSNLNTYTITLNNKDINNVFLAKDGVTMYNSLVFQKNTSGNPTAGHFGGLEIELYVNPQLQQLIMLVLLASIILLKTCGFQLLLIMDINGLIMAIRSCRYHQQDN
jgi:hypothetical protein